MLFVMKKIFISVIAVFYLSVTSGLVINMHFCMGQFSSVTFNHDADHEDGQGNKCGMKKLKNNCCTEEVTTLKLNDVHEASTFSFALASITSHVPEKQIVLHEPEQGISAIPVTDYFSPPPNTLNKVYLDINVFRI